MMRDMLKQEPGYMLWEQGKRILLMSVLLFTAACATKTPPPPPATTVTLNTMTVPNLPTVKSPRIRVYFLDVNLPGGGTKLCPAVTTFVGEVEDTGGITRKVELPTEVPVNASTGANIRKAFWVAVDQNKDRIHAPTGPGMTCEEKKEWFRYAIFFDPFGAPDYRSRMRKNINEPPQCDGSYDENKKYFYYVGKLNVADKDLLPEDVEFKYTIARMKKNGANWVIDEDCPPLDPMIKILR